MIWWILFWIFTAVVLILLIPIRMFLIYNGEFVLAVKVLFYKFKLPLGKKKDKKNKKIKKTKTQTKPQKTKSDGTDFLGKFKDIVSIVTSAKNRMLKRITVKKLKIEVTVASGDPADTAMTFGYMNAGIYPLVSFLENHIKIKNKKINITADYSKDKTEIVFFAVLATYPLRLLLGAIRVAIDYIFRTND